LHLKRYHRFWSHYILWFLLTITFYSPLTMQYYRR
jgi:hypothetical protein